MLDEVLFYLAWRNPESDSGVLLVDVVYPAGDPSEPRLEPAAEHWLDEVARRAENGNPVACDRLSLVWLAGS